MVARLPRRDYLYQIQHPTIPAKVMTFEPLGNTHDSNFARPGSMYVVPGTIGPIDNFGDAANPMDSRDYTFRFVRAYKILGDGSRETYTQATDEFRRMVVHGKRFTAIKKTVDGDLRYARFKLTSLKDVSNPDDDVGVTFDATFNMNPPYWYYLHREGIPVFNKVGWIFNIGGHKFNDAALFGYILNSASQTIHIDNTKATIPDYGAKFIISGKPINGYGGNSGIKVTNTSIEPNMSFTIPAYIPNGSTLTIDCATEAVRLNGIPRPDLLVLPRGQFDVMCIEAGIVNDLTIETLGTGARTTGYLDVDTRAKFA